MDEYHIISNKRLSLKDINTLLNSNLKLKLSDGSIQRIETCRRYLDDRMKKEKKPIYGINTGFGSLYNVKVSNENLQKLQENLVMSHACGTGDRVPKHVVKLMLFLKVQSLCYGHSGVQLITVQRLIDFYNHDIIPVIYTEGSLGASGDLAPLAHLALPLIGKGEVYHKDSIVKGEELIHIMNWEPIQLKSKEGLALLNGTQFMTAYGVCNLIESYKLSYLADLIGTISLEAYDGRIEPFNDLVHFVRPHNGQIKTASRIKEFLEGSEIISQEKKHVQDPYSFRCIPQVHGATKDAIDHVANLFSTEFNSVTDNPNIFVEADRIISGGNFHGQPLAIALDYLKIAMAELGNISERRTFQLVSGLRGLPNFLVENPGLNSGFMIPQYTAASIVSKNKQLATPASIDSIVSSNGQEDHVSMGANAAVQCYDLIKNLKTILAIELFNASQALFFRKPLKSSTFIDSFLNTYRNHIDFVTNDEVFHFHIKKTVHFIEEFCITNNLLFD
ncbi:histidine ammonia-lyase [Ichthyenterobacterium sp. W332]|uniref:Histidine ammonia-lyase n=1 Tax=Microcosmobacter mediterraneus TaxID=3075607 RepID=A0ABU2YNM0_9FLAO|nr:histidine ammonia-lyase [Ichthyenterobacterium sp. W332]MDT0559481.1 histidine ammonia-lyase [Ichthyenterobacterium sp. W332]